MIYRDFVPNIFIQMSKTINYAKKKKTAFGFTLLVKDCLKLIRNQQQTITASLMPTRDRKYNVDTHENIYKLC